MATSRCDSLTPFSVTAMLHGGALVVLAAVGLAGVAVPQASAFAQDMHRIPLAPGLTLVSATQRASGDQENIVTVGEVSPQGASYGWTFRQQTGKTVETGSFRRFVRAEDLASAPRLNAVFFSSDVDRFPGSTAFSMSRAVLQKLKAGHAVSYAFARVDGLDVGTGWTGAVGGLLRTRTYMRGTLTPVPNGMTRMPLLVNGRRVVVPVAQAKGSFTLRDQKLDGDFYLLDDPEHPLLLRIVIGGAAFQMIRVNFPESGAVAKLVETELAARCRAEIPGIYFEFGSADLRAESSPALAEIARAVAGHPDWKLSVEGHTDAVGTAPANLALSQRRADAVRAALATRHRVPASRLTSTGFGQTKPREQNTTLEGRARNRRVEIVRSCAGRL